MYVYVVFSCVCDSPAAVIAWPGSLDNFKKNFEEEKSTR